MPTTESIMLQTLAVPCACRCRYCLLCANDAAPGADLAESDLFALRFNDWLKENRPDISFNYSFGYSMERPDMAEALDLLNSMGSETGRFLQLDGLKMRTRCELDKLFELYRKHGVQSVNLTFYGNEAYHDSFSGRKGDRALLLRTLEIANDAGISASCGYPLTSESVVFAEETLDELLNRGANRVWFFIPHSEGRGSSIEGIRLVRNELDKLPCSVSSRLNRSVFRTESEWLSSSELPAESKRMLIISLTKENIRQYAEMGFEMLIRFAERLDEAYYSLFPSFKELAEEFGNRDGDSLFSYRDLFSRYRRLFSKRNGIVCYDVTNERQTGSRRY